MVDKRERYSSLADFIEMDQPSHLTASHSTASPPSIIERDDIQRLLKLVAAVMVLIGTTRLFTSTHIPVVQSDLFSVTEATTGFKVDVNHAAVDELRLLPQIGPMLANRIVAERETRGKFTSIEDLSRTAGIGPEAVERLRGLITISR
jgi:competence ComEA-like helix-hairpin-helix protein